MNSLLKNMGGGGNVMMQAFAAMMSGQSPKEFLTNLAKTRPELQGMDFDNLEKTANEVCDKKGVDPEEVKADLKGKFANLK
jgi:hypothetical protein